MCLLDDVFGCFHLLGENHRKSKACLPFSMLAVELRRISGMICISKNEHEWIKKKTPNNHSFYIIVFSFLPTGCFGSSPLF